MSLKYVFNKSKMNCNCKCNCDKCPCKDKDNLLDNITAFAGVEAYVTDEPADFAAVADLTIIIQGISNFYLYLLRAEPENFKLDESRKKLEEAQTQYSDFMKNSFISYAYTNSEAVESLLKTWKIYLNKCSELMLLRTDSRTRNTLFPITVMDNSIDGIF